MNDTAASRLWIVRWSAVVVILLALLLLMRALPLDDLLQWLEHSVAALGMWGPPVLVVVYVVATVLLVPGWILTVTIGALYGLVWGTLLALTAATTAAAVAFLIARYVARERVRQRIARSPKLAAIDEAIGQQGWKIVLLLRLSPVVPFNLQNYLYGVTAIRFWPCVLVSWVGMLPGAFAYIYLGTLGRAAAAGDEVGALQWALRGVGLAATIGVTWYLARLARRAIAEHTEVAAEEGPSTPVNVQKGSAWGTWGLAAVAVALLCVALWAQVRGDELRQSIRRWIGVTSALDSAAKIERGHPLSSGRLGPVIF